MRVEKFWRAHVVTQDIARYAATPKDERRIRREWKHVAPALETRRVGKIDAMAPATRRRA
jgi:hypothetical protein